MTWDWRSDFSYGYANGEYFEDRVTNTVCKAGASMTVVVAQCLSEKARRAAFLLLSGECEKELIRGR